MPVARRLNFKHLRYFLEVARTGSVSAAARTLHVAPQTVSAQLAELESAAGQQLFERSGRGLVLTPAGQVAQDYASTIFALGDELAGVLEGGAQPQRQQLRIGVTDAIAKLLTIAVVEPVLRRHRERVELVCREGSLAQLLGEASARQLDAVLADAPVPPPLARSLQARALMSSGLSFLCAPAVASTLKRGFPACLQGAPLLAGSGSASPLAQAIDSWLAQQSIDMKIVGRFDDSALMKGFAQHGFGVIAVPSSIEAQVVRDYGLVSLGGTPDVTQAIFLIRPRRLRPHPLVAEIETHFKA